MKLVCGQGSPDNGACWMSAIQHYATMGGGDWHDHPDCVDPIIRAVAIQANDWCTNDKREALIGPHLFTPVGTVGDEELNKKRRRFIQEKTSAVYNTYVRTTHHEELPPEDKNKLMSAMRHCLSDVSHLNSYGLAKSCLSNVVAMYDASHIWDPKSHFRKNNVLAQLYLDWTLELCAMSPKPDLDHQQIQRTLTEACLAPIN